MVILRTIMRKFTGCRKKVEHKNKDYNTVADGYHGEHKEARLDHLEYALFTVCCRHIILVTGAGCGDTRSEICAKAVAKTSLELERRISGTTGRKGPLISHMRFNYIIMLLISK